MRHSQGVSFPQPAVCGGVESIASHRPPGLQPRTPTTRNVRSSPLQGGCAEGEVGVSDSTSQTAFPQKQKKNCTQDRTKWLLLESRLWVKIEQRILYKRIIMNSCRDTKEHEEEYNEPPVCTSGL